MDSHFSVSMSTKSLFQAKTFLRAFHFWQIAGSNEERIQFQWHKHILESCIMMAPAQVSNAERRKGGIVPRAE